MQCPQCKSKEFKTSTVLDDAGDVERVTCANEECQYVLSEAIVEEAADGTKRKRPRSIKAESQPESFAFGGGEAPPEPDLLLSAEAMMLLAMKTQEETVGKQAKEIAKLILDECAANVLSGEHKYLIKEEDSTPGVVIVQMVQELKDRGYKVKKTATPGEGTEIHVKWPTKKATKTKKKKLAAEAAVQVGVVTTKGELTPKQQKQQAERAKRKAALKARSK
jgi:hypothetical protein